MKLLNLLLVLMACCTMAMPIACDDDADDAAIDTYNDDGGGDASADADDEEMDEGPMARESFDQVKAQWDLQINTARDSAAMLAKMNEEHKDQQMATMLEQANAKLAEAREKLDGATPQNGRQAMTKEIPKLIGEAGELNQKATFRIQDVLRSKSSGG